MTLCSGYVAKDVGAALEPFAFERRDPGPNDVRMDILYCGMCHSDLSFINNEWGMSVYPMVPGHEIVGRIVEVGSAVTKFRPGDIAAIGCIVDSCRHCDACEEGEEQMCVEYPTPTYGGFERGTGRPTHGGYSTGYVADADYVLRVPETLDPAAAAPLLCAGITTYSPLRHWNVGPGMRVGIVGLGGLGHVAIKLARAMGATVVALTTSPAKVADALALGAHEAILSTDAAAMSAQMGSFDFILDTVSAEHDVNALLGLLRRSGTLCLVGAPGAPLKVYAMAMIMGNKKLVGSGIGGIAQTQEMLDFCGQHGIVADIELVPVDQVNAAMERLKRHDVKYRFVLDLAPLKA